MRKFMGSLAIGLVVTSAGCVDTMNSGYPNTYGYDTSGYGYNQPTYYSQPAYYGQPTYYQPVPRVVTQTRYVPVPVATPQQPRRLRDRDHDGIPDRYDSDKNGDGIPDRLQRRG